MSRPLLFVALRIANTVYLIVLATLTSQGGSTGTKRQATLPKAVPGTTCVNFKRKIEVAVDGPQYQKAD
jgi:hypothetical protein